MANITTIPMPARGDRNAPQFDSRKPHELRRYFTDLEFLFGRSSVTANDDKKKHATRFLSVEDQEVWETIESFSDAAKSYDDFKGDILRLYAGNNEDRRYAISDLDALIGEYSRVGILSMDDLTTFYRQFLRITTYLISKNRLSATEQSRAFLRAMHPASFAREIKLQLRIKNPNNHPEDPYPLSELYEAAEFALAGSSGIFNTNTPSALTTPNASPASPGPIEIKPDPSLAALVGTMTEFMKMFASQKVNTDSSPPKRPRSDNCGYCGELGHFISDCNKVLEDMQAGKCKRNVEGRIVLPSGAYVPKAVTGSNLRERFNKWHEQNPGQLAVSQLFADVMPRPSSSSTTPAPEPVRTFTLTDEQRMEMLQHEINALQTRAQAKKALANKGDEELDRAVPPPVQTPASPGATGVPIAPGDPIPTPGLHPAQQQPHPFAKARDAAYAPPKERNAGLPPVNQPKFTPAYRTNAPVYNEKDAADVFQSSLDAQVTLTQRQLLSIAPEVRSHMREVTTSRRAPPKDHKNPEGPAAQLLNDLDQALPFSGENANQHDSLEEQRDNDARHTACLDAYPDSYLNSAQVNLPPGGIVVPDPLEVYYNSGSFPEDLVVSMESSAIRSILPIIDNQQQVEAIVDGGSQIIAMSEGVCHELALLYDPGIILRMQSANGAITPSLGLARNVPFRIGDIVLYLQVHILRNPAYDVLLGRPFDVLTQSIIHNFANEDQTITICDPNTGKLATVPTVPRGPPRHRKQGFHN
jgi:hypothetical protein